MYIHVHVILVEFCPLYRDHSLRTYTHIHVHIRLSNKYQKSPIFSRVNVPKTETKKDWKRSGLLRTICPCLWFKGLFDIYMYNDMYMYLYGTFWYVDIDMDIDVDIDVDKDIWYINFYICISDVCVYIYIWYVYIYTHIHTHAHTHTHTHTHTYTCIHIWHTSKKSLLLIRSHKYSQEAALWSFIHVCFDFIYIYFRIH